MYVAQRNHGSLGGAQVEILPPLTAPSIADEAHHRIANSLQLLCATLSLEARDIADERARSTLSRIQNRISAIAGVHRQLHRGNAAGEVDLSEYIQELGESLAMSCPPERRVLIQSEAIYVRGEDATAIGMIVSELVTNACKYAYPVGTPGDVSVRLRRVSNGFLLMVEDHGQGFQTAPSEMGLGHRLITRLAKQLRAAGKWGSCTSGTRFELFCPAR